MKHFEQNRIIAMYIALQKTPCYRNNNTDIITVWGPSWKNISDENQTERRGSDGAVELLYLSGFFTQQILHCFAKLWY